jgi:hypothetical protein
MILAGTTVIVANDVYAKVYLSETDGKVFVPKNTAGICTVVIGDMCKLTLDTPLEWSCGKETDEKYGKKKTNTIWLHESHVTRKLEG